MVLQYTKLFNKPATERHNYSLYFQLFKPRFVHLLYMQSPVFKRTIGLYTATSLVIGSVIGSGIFMRPAEMAFLLGSPYRYCWFG